MGDPQPACFGSKHPSFKTRLDDNIFLSERHCTFHHISGVLLELIDFPRPAVSYPDFSSRTPARYRTMDGHDSNPLTAADIGAILEIGISKVSDGGPAPEVDIVFVHGLEGHPEKTWTEKQPDPTPQPVKSKRAKVKNALHIRSKAKLPVHESQEPPCFWPRDLLAKDFPQARIYTYGYDSRITRFFRGTTSTSNIHDQGRGLNRAVASIRSKCRGRPLIFIAHSLGGLVVKSVSPHPTSIDPSKRERQLIPSFYLVVETIQR